MGQSSSVENDNKSSVVKVNLSPFTKSDFGCTSASWTFGSTMDPKEGLTFLINEIQRRGLLGNELIVDLDFYIGWKGFEFDVSESINNALLLLNCKERKIDHVLVKTSCVNKKEYDISKFQDFCETKLPGLIEIAPEKVSFINYTERAVIMFDHTSSDKINGNSFMFMFDRYEENFEEGLKELRKTLQNSKILKHEAIDIKFQSMLNKTTFACRVVEQIVNLRSFFPVGSVLRFHAPTNDSYQREFEDFKIWAQNNLMLHEPFIKSTFNHMNI
jgi:hypothetical protein